MNKFTAKHIIDRIGHKNLYLYAGNGYWYFVYDNKLLDSDLVYMERPIMVNRLNRLTIEEWVEEGLDFLIFAEQKNC